jgi:hypothetical protein
MSIMRELGLIPWGVGIAILITSSVYYIRCKQTELIYFMVIGILMSLLGAFIIF